MKNSNCSIIKDLIPNYIEDLVSDETKAFMENHINTSNGSERTKKGKYN